MTEAPPTPAAATAASPSRLRRWLPTLVGLGFAALGLAATGFALSGLDLRVRPAQAPSEAADPIALLRDDVATVQNDLGALSKGIGTNLEALGGALDTAAEERHAEQVLATKSLAGRLARLETSLAALSQEDRRLREEVKALRGALAGSRAGGVAATPSQPPAPEAKPESKPEPKPEPEPVAAAPAPAEPAEPAAPKRRKRGLFSFKMAGGGPDFSERQRYTVIASLSRVGFDAKSSLHDFSGVTSKVEGSFTGKLAASDPEAKGRIRALVADLRTGVDGRDEEMRKVLAAEKHPYVQFDLSSLEVSESDSEARTSVATGRGAFTIRGVSREVAVPLKVSVDASKRLVLTGEATLDLTQFEVEVPSMGAIGMESEVKVWLSLRLRSLGKAGE